MSSYYRSILNTLTVPFTNTKSIALDGVDDYVDFGASSTIADGGQFSFSFWIKGGSQVGNRYLFSADYYNQNTFWRVSGTNFQWMNINGTVINVSIGVLDNNWHHILVIWNPDGANSTIRCFTDGANERNVSNDWRYGTNGIYKGALRYIGGTSVNGLNGNLDEIAFWNDDQSSNVSAIYNSGQVHDLNALSSPPVHWYRCGDGDTAPTLTDNGSAGNNGTMTNFSTFSSDVPIELFSRKSILLDGVDDYVDCGNPTSLQITGALTISAWVKTTNTSTNGIVVGKDGVDPSATRSYQLQIVSSGEARLVVFKSGSTLDIVTGTSAINNGNWHHIMGVNDGTDLKIYVDGALEATDVGGGGTMTNGTANLNIGRRQGNTANELEFLGNIDEVAVWNSDQSANASVIYNSGVPNDISSLSPVSWWRCGDGDTSPTLTDNGSAGNNGTMTNFSTFSTNVPT